MSAWLQSSRERLIEGASQLELTLDEDQIDELLGYLQLLVKWNSAYNLTAVRDPLEMVSRHLLDSLAIVPFMQGKTLLDVGTGAGLPGVPLSIVQPECNYTLLDSNGKKTRFIRQAAFELGLKNNEVIQSRIEDYKPDATFDMVTARAFTELPRLIDLTQRFIEQGGRLMALKGSVETIDKEIKASGNHEITVQRLDVPFVDEERHLLIVRN